MTHQDLTDLLERAGERTVVGPPPLDEIVTRTGRTRRRRRAFVASVAVGAAVVAVAAVGATISRPADRPGGAPSPADTSPTLTPAPAPVDLGSLNGTWKVTALVGADGHSLLTGRYADQLRLTLKDGALSGTWGCNDIFGGYRLSGADELVFPGSSLGSTTVGCDAPPLLQRLLLVRHVSGSGDVRTFHAANWMILIQVHRIDPG